MAITLKMKKEDYEKILAHCRAGLPNESCGLLAGDIDGEIKMITDVYLLTNIDASNEHFSMDPKEQLAAVKDAIPNAFTIAVLAAIESLLSCVVADGMINGKHRSDM